jgi:hypothetical protein
MSRRANIFEDVMSLPWPFGLVASAISFALMHYVLANPPTGAMGSALVLAIKPVGWFFTTMFLLAGILSFLTQAIRSKRFKVIKGIADTRSPSCQQLGTWVGVVFWSLVHAAMKGYLLKDA